MKVLLTNDDGICSDGITALAEVFCAKNYEVVVVAPNEQRSACSHSITIHTPLNYQRVSVPYKADAFSTNGTPADCVKIAIMNILNAKPDVVISGINSGPNLGSDVMYSGTVGAALEAAFLGVRAFAVSLSDFKQPKSEFLRAASHFESIFMPLYNAHKVKNTILNVNYPTGEYKGVVFARLGVNEYNDHYRPVENGFMLHGKPLRKQSTSAETDVEACFLGYVTVTPVKLDRTDYDALGGLCKLKL